jgi:hypothetical protein
MREAISLRHRQSRLEQSQARGDAVRAEIREILRTLHAAGTCPSVPRAQNAVDDARREAGAVIA